MSASNECSHCGHVNRSGALLCEECGSSLVDQDGIPTKKLPPRDKRRNPQNPIMLHVRDTDEPIVLDGIQELVIGRLEADNAEAPDLDLTPYGAPDKGVSRLHATLCVDNSGVKLMDMGSSNGTFVNGQRLNPNQSLPVHDGDEIRLGRLVAHIYLK